MDTKNQHPLGIIPNLSNEAYHGGPGISKSGLWKIESKTPAHWKGEERTEKDYFDLGHAIHTAILEPDLFDENTFLIRQDAPNRPTSTQLKAIASGKGTEKAQESVAYWNMIDAKRKAGIVPLVQADIDTAQMIADKVHSSSRLNSIITSGTTFVEHSAYSIDEETGTLCRVRPDLANETFSLGLDLKTSKDASPKWFPRDAANYGYHAQEAFYTDVWHAAGGCSIEGFLFLVFEKEPPFEWSLFELPPEAIAEGRAAMRHALNLYAECVKAEHWPGYSDEVQEMRFPHWAYRHTPAPTYDDGEPA